jgi:uncharacterized protein
MRVLLLLLLILAIVWLVRSSRRRPPPNRQSTKKPTDVFEDMVACQHCGVHLATSEAIQIGPGRYSCPEHSNTT